LIKLMYLQRRRLLLTWFATCSIALSCSCVAEIPEGIDGLSIATGILLLFLLSMVPVATAVVAIYWLPPLRCLFDALASGVLLTLVFEASASLAGLKEGQRDVAFIVVVLLLVYAAFGGKGFRKWTWIRYSGIGRTTLPGLPESLWPRLVVGRSPVSEHLTPNLLSASSSPDDPSRVKALYAMHKGSVLTMDITIIQESAPVGIHYVHTGDSPILEGALAVGSFGFHLTPTGPDSTDLDLFLQTGPLPIYFTVQLWLDDLAGDEAEMFRESLLGRPHISLLGRAMKGFMKTYQSKRTNTPSFF
jgi:hypothetical protein